MFSKKNSSGTLPKKRGVFSKLMGSLTGGAPTTGDKGLDSSSAHSQTTKTRAQRTKDCVFMSVSPGMQSANNSASSLNYNGSSSKSSSFKWYAESMDTSRSSTK